MTSVKPAVARFVAKFRTIADGLEMYVKEQPHARLDEVKRMAREINVNHRKGVQRNARSNL
jgi:hypothetical protein